MRDFQKSVVIRAAVIAVLTVNVILGIVLSPQVRERRMIERGFLTDFHEKQFSAVEIRTAGFTFSFLKNEDSSWTVERDDKRYPARDVKISSFITMLSSIRSVRIVSQRPEQWQSFGVQEDESTSLTIRDTNGKVLQKLYIGKASTTGNGSYVRVSGEKRIYEVMQPVRAYLDEDISYWCDLRLLPEEVTDRVINRILIQSDMYIGEGSQIRRIDDIYSLVRGTGGAVGEWLIEGKDYKPDRNTVEEMVRSIANLEGSDFSRDREAGFDSPGAAILISTIDGRHFRILIGNKTKESYHAALEGSAYTYLVSEWNISRILKTLPELGVFP